MHLREGGSRTFTSAQLSEVAGVNSAQIRSDFRYLGFLGTRGVGYEVTRLANLIQHTLGLNGTQLLAVVGAGNLGSSILQHESLRAHGFVVGCVFDPDERRVGTSVGGVVVRDFREFGLVVRDQGVRLGVIAVAPEAAQEVADVICDSGIEFVVNYSNAVVHTHVGVTVCNLDPARELLSALHRHRAGGVVTRL